MKPPPKNWPRISSALFYQDPQKAIAWLCDAFGFEVIIKVEGKDGSVEHSELRFDGGRGSGRPPLLLRPAHS